MSTHYPAKILVIEDNPADIEILRYALDKQQENYQLQILVDGEEALDFVSKHRSGVHLPHPCVIVLDLHLPKYDGRAILKEIRKTPDLKHIHVVLTTSVATPQEQRDLSALGAIITRKPNTLQEALAFAQTVMEICKGWTMVQA